MWDKEDEVERELSAARSFDLVPVSSIRGRVDDISTKTAATLTDEVQRKQEFQKLEDGNSDRSRRMFYVNRFYPFKTHTHKAIRETESTGDSTNISGAKYLLG